MPATGRPGSARLVEKWLPGATGASAPWRATTSRRRVDPIHGVTTVVIHATAGTTTRGAFSVMQAGKASYHWLVPDEDEPAHGGWVWATAPERRAAWHVRNSCRHPAVANGAGRLNHVSLGVGIVNAQHDAAERPDRFSDWQVEATAAIVRYAWGKYPNLRHVVSHARLDPGRRTDPGPHFPWERLEALVFSRSQVSGRCDP